MRKVLRLMVAGLAMLAIGLGIVPPAPEVQAQQYSQYQFRISSVWVKAEQGMQNPPQYMWTEVTDGSQVQEAVINSGVVIPMATYSPVPTSTNGITWWGEVSIREWVGPSIGSYGPVLYTGPMSFNSEGVAFFEGFTYDQGGPFPVNGMSYSQSSGLSWPKFYEVRCNVRCYLNGSTRNIQNADYTTTFRVIANGP